jgi:hypothetical protein
VIAQVLADQLAELETDEHRVWVNLKGKDGKMFSAAAHRVQRVADGQGLTASILLEEDCGARMIIPESEVRYIEITEDG